MRIITTILSVLLIITGIYAIALPFKAFYTVGWVIGIMLFVSGINLVINYFTLKKTEAISAWNLFEGIITVIFALFILYGQFARMVLDSFIIVLFGIWIIASGILRIMAANELRRTKSGSWLWGTIFGTLSVVAGIYGFLNPMVFKFTIGWLVGIMIMMNGIALLSFGMSIGKKE